MNDREYKFHLQAPVPLITVGITCYNAANTIGRAILSARRQTWPNTEIIVVDDASTDTSRAVLEALADHNPDIRVIRHSVNKGLSGAENTIVNEARGDFIALFDDDDESVPERLDAQWRRIKEYERAKRCKLVLCYSNRNVVNCGAYCPEHVAKAIGRRTPEPHGAAVADYLFGHHCDPRFVWGLFGSCTLMARRETFLAVGPFDESFRRCAEWDMAIRAAFMGAHFIAVDQPLVLTYKTMGTDKADNIPLQYALQLRTKYKEHLTGRKAYWSSCALAHYNFHGNKGRKWKSRAYFLMACLASPVFVLRKLSSRILHRSRLCY